ncbi:MAG: SMP-30/gluconolactonase/LRE family protein [Planctomycetota bacterium]|nr:SMP-30/gluconolactonase/LRE family protein [Planctomycetota bacterium]
MPRYFIVSLVFSVTVSLAIAPGVAQDPADEVTKVAAGFGFVEGPAWDPINKRLLFSDIRNDRILALSKSEEVSTYLEGSGRSNGLVFDREGNLYACLGGARQVVKIAGNGARTVLADKFGGKRLNSPNDLALDDMGGIYFTDPRYGQADDLEQDVMAVYYIHPDRRVARVIGDLKRPNGILVSRDGSGLYVAEPDKREIHFYPILAPGVVGKGHVLFRSDGDRDGRGPDGMAIDENGLIYATYRNLLVLNASGKLQRRIAVPEVPANCVIGGAGNRTLYITARTGLYRVGLSVPAQALRTTTPRPRISSKRLPRFEVVDVDSKIGVGYGLAVTEMNGDGKPDIVLVDRQVIQWYENPGWKKHSIVARLTPRDHVCLAARDIDGDGLAELAAGAGWNPGDTQNSGSVHRLLPIDGRSRPWQAVQLPHEPTVHRMRWVRISEQDYRLVVVPLHGRGNRAGQGAGVRLLEYQQPGEGNESWQTRLIDASLHVTHNFDPVQWDQDPAEELLVGSREGLYLFDRGADGWQRTQLTGRRMGETSFRGAGEIRAMQIGRGSKSLATIEPFHGNQVVVYTSPEAGSPRTFWRRQVLDSDLRQGHAIASGDLLGSGVDQIVVGWRNKNAAGKFGIRYYIALHSDGRSWQRVTVDDSEMACEDLRLADVDGDGRLDIVAAGRATRNLRVYFNRPPSGN